MREIKFRAWIEPTKEMVYQESGIMADHIQLYTYFDSLVRIMNLSVINASNKRVNCLLQLYTGLKDKNGKEIYEGDIIQSVYEFEGKKQLGVVNFINGCFTLNFLGDIELDGELLCSACSMEEIIGNLYENPELLEEKKDADNKAF